MGNRGEKMPLGQAMPFNTTNHLPMLENFTGEACTAGVDDIKGRITEKALRILYPDTHKLLLKNAEVIQ